MSDLHNCQRCQLPISEERLTIVPLVCNHCGHAAVSDRPHKSQERSDSYFMIAIAGTIVAGFLVATSSFEMRWLQLRSMIGASSVSSLDRLAALCEDLKKTSCVEKALADQARIDSKRTTKYASYLMSRRKFNEAAQVMNKYVQRGKADTAAYATLAEALAESGRMDEAAQYFERSIAGKHPSMDHVQLYVKSLARAKRFDQALAVILRVRRTQVNALPSEYRIISEMRNATNRHLLADKH